MNCTNVATRNENNVEIQQCGDECNQKKLLNKESGLVKTQRPPEHHPGTPRRPTPEYGLLGCTSSQLQARWADCCLSQEHSVQDGLPRNLAIHYPDLHCPGRQKLCHLRDAAATGSGDTIVSNIDGISTQWGDPFFIESSAVLLECLLS